MRDLHNNIKTTTGLAPAAITTNTTTVGATVDRQGFESCEFAVQSGVVTDGSYAVQVFAGDAANMSDEAQAAAADLIGTEPTVISTEDAAVEKVGYKGGKRYVRIKVVSTGVTTGALLAALAILGNARNAPVA